MLILEAGERITCDKAEKGKDFIKVYLDGKCIMEYNGISDFGSYKLTDESGNPAAFTAPDPTEAERLRALESAVLAMMMGGVTNV